MRSLVLVFLFFITGIQVSAQPLNNALTGTIIKEEAIMDAPANRPLSISDFRYQSEFSSDQYAGEQTQKNAAIPFFASAVVPGAGQAINDNWGRAAAYFGVEVASIVYYLNRNSTARSNEDAYEKYANQNWSPIAYAQWLVDYSRANNLNANLAALDNLENHVAGLSPNYQDVTQEWTQLDINLVRSVEVRTPFIFTSGLEKSEFSHVLQDYNSQQYYELMSKYYQFQPGWQDFHEMRLAQGADHLYRYSWDANMLTDNFREGRDRAEEFNNNYRQAGNILKLILVNHVVSAFDALFTRKLRNSRIETNTNLLMSEKAFSVTWHF